MIVSSNCDHKDGRFFVDFLAKIEKKNEEKEKEKKRKEKTPPKNFFYFHSNILIIQQIHL